MAKKKPVPRKNAPKKALKKPIARPTKVMAAAVKPATIVDSAAVLADLGFFRGEYHWEADRDVPAFDARLRLLVDHVDGRVHPEQARSVEWVLASKRALRPLALKAAYECMLGWVEGYRQRHPGFRGKPIGEKPFTRGCELKSVSFPAPPPGEAKPAPRSW